MVNPVRGWGCPVGSPVRRLKPAAIHGGPLRGRGATGLNATAKRWTVGSRGCKPTETEIKTNPPALKGPTRGQPRSGLGLSGWFACPQVETCGYPQTTPSGSGCYLLKRHREAVDGG